MTIKLSLTFIIFPATITMASEQYISPENSGLIAERAFPTSIDICQVLGENKNTSKFFKKTSLLIGCPKHETGAINDRKADGFKVVGQVKSWVLLGKSDDIGSSKPLTRKQKKPERNLPEKPFSTQSPNMGPKLNITIPTIICGFGIQETENR